MASSPGKPSVRPCKCGDELIKLRVIVSKKVNRFESDLAETSDARIPPLPLSIYESISPTPLAADFRSDPLKPIGMPPRAS